MAHLSLSIRSLSARGLRRTLVATACAVVCTGALADPVSLVAGALSLAGYTGAAFAVAVVGGFLSSANARRQQAAAAAQQRAQYNASLQDRNVTGLSAEAPWRVVYGSPAPVGGSIAAILSSGDKDQYKHLLVVFAAHECQAIDEIYIDGDACGTLDGSGNVTAGAFYDVGTDQTATESVNFSSGTATLPSGRSALKVVSIVLRSGSGDTATEATYAGTASGSTITSTGLTASGVLVTYSYSTAVARVNVQKHLSPGGADTADAYVQARCPAQWGPSDKLSGYTYAFITLDQTLARFQGGIPNITAKLRGKKLYDPRTATTAYSNNPALALGDFIMAEYGFGASLAQIDSAAWIAAANAADASGFACDGSFTTDQDRETTKQQLEDAFGATCHRSGGVWRIMAGAWTSPVMTLTDADCAAPIQIVQASYPAKARYNTVRGKYIDAAGLGVATDFTPWVNSSYVTADGQSRVKDVSFPFTGSHQRCQDLARMQVERSRGGLLISYPAHLRAWPLQPGDRVSITNAEFGWSSKTFRVQDWAFHPRTPVALQLVEDVAAFYDAAAIITADAAPNTNLPSPFSVPALVLAQDPASGTAQLIKQPDGTITNRVYLLWNAASSNYVTTGGRVQIQWRMATATDGSWNSVEPLPGDATSTYLMGLPDGVNVLIRLRFINQLQIPGAWTTVAHTVVGKTAAPSDVTSFAVNADGIATWSEIADLDAAGYILRWQPGTNTSWGDASPLHEGVVTDSPYAVRIRPSGVATYLIKAIDTTGNLSANAAKSVINLGDPVVANVVTSYDYKANGFPGTITNATVSGGNLVADADASPLMWNPNAATAMWTYDTAPMWTTVTYKPMTYTLPVFVVAAADAGAQLTLPATVVADAYIIEYRRDGDARMWNGDTEPMWTNDAAPMWQTEDYRPWPGNVVAAAGRYEWRITTQSRLNQSQITALKAQLDVKDQFENVGLVSILAAGTVIPTTKTWRSITGIGLTLVADAGTAETVRIEDRTTRTVTTRNAANAAVNGTVLATLQGY